METNKEHILRQSKRRDAGFTLLEVLIALSLVSLVTIAIFQSFISMTRLSDRAQRTTEASFNEHVDAVLLGRVVEGLFPERANKARNVFQGSGDEFSGMSSGFILPDMGNKGLAFFKVSLVNGKVILVLDDREFAFSSKAEAQAFSYLGTDRNWHSEWPPANALPFGPIENVQNQDHELALPPLLPLAIRINFVDESDWIALPRGSNRIKIADDEI